MKLSTVAALLLALVVLGCSSPTVPELAEERLSQKPDRVARHWPALEQEASRESPSPERLRLSDLRERAVKGDVDALAELTAEAESGDAQAQHFLALAYSGRNRGAHPEAVKWYRRAAAQGVLQSVAALGGCYADGRGVEKDMERGVGLMRAAADMGESLSQYRLGDLYRAPGGLPKDLAQTYAWHAIMIASLPESPSVKNPGTQANMIEVTRFRLDRLAEKMTPEQIAEGERLAALWQRKSWDEVRDDVQRFL